MFDKDEFIKIHKVQMVPITKQQAEQLENWCKDFQSFLVGRST